MEHPFVDFSQSAREILDRIPAIVLRVDYRTPDKRIVYISNKVTLYGYSAEDILSGKFGWDQAVRPEDYPSVVERIQRNIDSGKDEFMLIYRMIAADKSIFWINDYSSVQRAEDGTVLYLDRVVTDYSTVKGINDKLEEKSKQLVALNKILIGLHSNDIDQAFVTLLNTAGQYLDISRVILFEDSPDHTTCRAVFEWDNTGIQNLMSRPGGFVLDYENDIPEILEDLDNKGMRAINYGDIPQASVREFNDEGVIAAAIFAIHENDRRSGFICFDECVLERVWESDTLAFLGTIANFVSTALIRRSQTGAIVSSRHAMSTILNNINDAIFVVDPDDYEFVFANEAARNLHNIYSNQFARGNPLFNEIMGSNAYRWEVDIDAPPVLYEIPYSNDTYYEIRLKDILWYDERTLRLFCCRDITEPRKQELYIRQMAFTDMLTKLPNRYQCDTDLEVAITRAREQKKLGYLLFIDMDDFKIINDGYGHDFGDALLIEFAHYLKQTALPYNKVFRFGGDEFLVLVDPSNADLVDYVIDRIITRAREPWYILNKVFYCTVSVGVVCFPDADLTARDILKNVDIAMYQAKTMGKDSFAFYSESMRNDAIDRSETERLMRECIVNNFKGFKPYYQPFVEPESNEIIGAEALLRWFKDDGSMIMPMDFIPLAEYLGLIVDLGNFVLRESCNLLKRINESGLPNFSISVNVSIRQLQQHDFVATVMDIINETCVNPRNLVLEITESIAATDSHLFENICNPLRRIGIRISIDDFGTGYSSLSTMRDMPFDILKIDRTFIQNIDTDPFSLSFTRLISNLGRTMSKTICVEGVETIDQVSYCNEITVDMLQGFYYYRPMPVPDFEKLILPPPQK